MAMSEYSLSDLAAVTDGNGWGNGAGAWWMIILFAMIFGGNGWGWGRSRVRRPARHRGGAVQRNELQPAGERGGPH